MLFRPRRVAFAMLTAATTAFAFVAACGVDIVGGVTVPVEAAPDVRGEASLPPTNDGNVPDVITDAGTPDADAQTAPCGTNLRGPAMVEVPDAGFCIDSTEVTGAQYAEFLAATDGGAADAGFLDASTLDGGLPPFCKRDGFAPGGGTSFDAGPPALPVARVSWCDAFAYCQWAGKRLCTGKVSSVDTGEWLRACTRDGTQKVSPADGDAAACNLSVMASAPPKTFAGCQGGYNGIFDMIGNVEEWVGSCDGGSTCMTLGGNYTYTPQAVTCDTSISSGPNTSTVATGIRCCR